MLKRPVVSSCHHGTYDGRFQLAELDVGMSMKEAEKKLIFETLRETSGNRTQAAKVLSISIRTLRNKLNEYAADGEGPDFELRD